MKLPYPIPALALLLTAVMALSRPAKAFDTGHHADLTRDAMAAEGFHDTPIRIAQFENWLTDYFSPGQMKLRHPIIQGQVQFLHCDNLKSTTNIRSYFQWLTYNTKNAVKKALESKNQKEIRLLTILGISLHTVQDFYTHSNWVDLMPHDANGYNTVTWFDTENTGKTPEGLHTGYYPNDTAPSPKLSHAYMNHDSYRRKDWDQAYVAAYSATRQWLFAFKGWTGTETWDQLTTFTVSDSMVKDLDTDLDASYHLSERAPAEGGHWKGPGSSDATLFIAKLARFAAHSSCFFDQFTQRAVQEDLIDGLEQATEAPPELVSTPPWSPTVDPIPTIALHSQALIVRTVDTKAFQHPDLLSKPDFYADITIKAASGQIQSEQTFRENTIVNQEGPQLDDVKEDNRGNQTWPWFTLKIVDAGITKATIRYDLWDEDEPDGDDVCDINPSQGQTSLTFDYHPLTNTATGDITVDSHHPQPVTPDMVTAVHAGVSDGNAAKVTFFVFARPLVFKLPHTIPSPPYRRQQQQDRNGGRGRHGLHLLTWMPRPHWSRS